MKKERKRRATPRLSDLQRICSTADQFAELEHLTRCVAYVKALVLDSLDDEKQTRQSGSDAPTTAMTAPPPS